MDLTFGGPWVSHFFVDLMGKLIFNGPLALKRIFGGQLDCFGEQSIFNSIFQWATGKYFTFHG